MGTQAKLEAEPEPEAEPERQLEAGTHWHSSALVARSSYGARPTRSRSRMPNSHSEYALARAMLLISFRSTSPFGLGFGAADSSPAQPPEDTRSQS